MLEKPDLPDARLSDALQAAYGLPVAQVTFLPLGWDVHTAVYRIDSSAGQSYFLKLRSSGFDAMMVTLPHLLQAQGVPGLIAPLPAQDGNLWGALDFYTLILYPYIEGQNAYRVALNDRHWAALGEILSGVHRAHLAPEVRARLRREHYDPHWRDSVRAYLAQVVTAPAPGPDGEPVAQRLVDFLRTSGPEIERLVQRSAQLARALQADPPPFVLCHSDAHPGNLHVAGDGALYLVDWDAPLLAPKELDLMFAGAGMGSTPDGRPYGAREEALFYQGYGRSLLTSPGSPAVNPAALAYYRYERIIVDLAEFCDQIFQQKGSLAEREQALEYLRLPFLPGGALELARSTDPTGG